MDLLAGAALLAVFSGTAAGAVIHAIVRSRLEDDGTLALFALCGLGAAAGGAAWIGLDYAVFGGPDAPWDDDITAIVIAVYGLVLSAVSAAWSAAWPPPVRRPVGLALHRVLPRSFRTAPSPGPRRFGCAISFGVGGTMTVAYMCGVLLSIRITASPNLWTHLAVATLLATTPAFALLIRRAVRHAR